MADKPQVSQSFQDGLDSLLITDEDIIVTSGPDDVRVARWRSYTLLSVDWRGQIIRESRDAPPMAIVAAKRLLGVD